jgi:hypothetical protein
MTYAGRTSPLYEYRGVRDNEGLHRLLALILKDAPSVEMIAGWSRDEFDQVTDWAVKERFYPRDEHRERPTAVSSH